MRQTPTLLCVSNLQAGRTYGNTDFAISCGAEAAEASEWIILPRFRNGTSHLPTTLGSHNPTSTFSVEAKENSGVTIDDEQGIIYLPWGVLPWRLDNELYQCWRRHGLGEYSRTMGVNRRRRKA